MYVALCLQLCRSGVLAKLASPAEVVLKGTKAYERTHSYDVFCCVPVVKPCMVSLLMDLVRVSASIFNFANVSHTTLLVSLGAQHHQASICSSGHCAHERSKTHAVEYSVRCCFQLVLLELQYFSSRDFLMCWSVVICTLRIPLFRHVRRNYALLRRAVGVNTTFPTRFVST